jgi:hypothetical protein
MKNKLLFLLLFSITTFCFSQKVTLLGSVKDSLQNSMSYANVITNSKDVSKNLQFAIIDNEGYYKEEIA